LAKVTRRSLAELLGENPDKAEEEFEDEIGTDLDDAVEKGQKDQ